MPRFRSSSPLHVSCSHCQSREGAGAVVRDEVFGRPVDRMRLFDEPARRLATAMLIEQHHLQFPPRRQIPANYCQAGEALAAIILTTAPRCRGNPQPVFPNSHFPTAKYTQLGATLMRVNVTAYGRCVCPGKDGVHA